MPSPAREEDRNPTIDDEVEDDDSDSEMDMDEDSEDFEESLPVQPISNPGEDDEFPSSSTDDENRTQNPNSNNNNHHVVFADPPLNHESQTQHQNLPSLIPVSTSSSSHNGVGVATSMQQPHHPSGSVALPVLDETLETPDAKRSIVDGTIMVSEERKSASSVLEDSRRLFQRLWTDEDEIAILQGFYEFTSQRGTTHHAHQHDTGPFYDQIRTKLQLDFNKNQLVEKLRRLKKKYRNVVNRMNSGKDFVFKSPHDQATFEISRKIWSNSIISRTGNYDQDEDDDANDAYHNETGVKVRKRGKKRTHPDASVTATGSEPVAVEVKVVPTLTTLCPPPVTPAASTSLAPLFPNVVEETVRNCFSPVFKEILNSGIGGSMVAGLGGGTSALAMGMMPLSLMSNSGNLFGSASKDGEVGEKWRKQQILELKVYSKRLELVQEQINVTLSELQSEHK